MSVRRFLHGSLLACLAAQAACAQALLGEDEYVLGEGGGGEGTDSGNEVPSMCGQGLAQCSGSCVSLDSDALNCGHCGRSCQGAECKDGACAPMVVAADIDQPRALAVDDTHVYWTTAPGAVQRALRDGGAVETLADHQELPGAIAADAQYVFWVNESSGRVMRLSKDDLSKTPKMLFNANGLKGLALGSDSAYLTRKLKKGEIQRVAKGDGSPNKLAINQPDPSTLRVVGDRLVWAGVESTASRGGGEDDSLPPGGYIRSMPLAGGAISTLTAGEGDIVALASAGASVFWADETNLLIRSCDMGGGDVITVADGQDVRGLVAQGDEVVWSTAGGTIKLAGLSTGVTTVLAIDVSNLGPVFLGGDHVYFLRTGQNGAVLRVAK